MTKDEKKLLIRDLCSRLPYGIILDIDTTDWEAPQGHIKLKIEGLGILFKDMSLIVNGSYYGNKYKPYLRPMSSITEEQKEELENLGWNFNNSEIHNVNECLGTYREYVVHSDCSTLIDWLNKNHFDYRGLIENGLAIDATGLNIY